MKTTVPLKNKRKSPVHEAEKPVEFDEISTPEENNQNSEENGPTSDAGDDEIPDFENEPKGTNFYLSLKPNYLKQQSSLSSFLLR